MWCLAGGFHLVLRSSFLTLLEDGSAGTVILQCRPPLSSSDVRPGPAPVLCALKITKNDSVRAPRADFPGCDAGWRWFALSGRIRRAAILAGGPRFMRHWIRVLYLAEGTVPVLPRALARSAWMSTICFFLRARVLGVDITRRDVRPPVTRSHPVGFTVGGMHYRDPAWCVPLADD